MITIENVVLPSAQQWQAVIRGMRNPKNSWDKSDSSCCQGRSEICDNCVLNPEDDYAPCYFGSSEKGKLFVAGDNDLDLMGRLANAGSVHAKFRRMLPVFVDINAPLYWWKEMDTYKVGTVANSCSTMHKIQAKEFEPIDFSIDQLSEESMACVNTSLAFLNENRRRFLECEHRLKVDDNLTQAERKHLTAQQKHYWYQMIQLLPSAYNQRRTMLLNYEVLTNIYEYRKAHKLDEWREFCKWIETLPYFNEIITHR